MDKEEGLDSIKKLPISTNLKLFVIQNYLDKLKSQKTFELEKEFEEKRLEEETKIEEERLSQERIRLRGQSALPEKTFV